MCDPRAAAVAGTNPSQGEVRAAHAHCGEFIERLTKELAEARSLREAERKSHADQVQDFQETIAELHKVLKLCCRGAGCLRSDHVSLTRRRLVPSRASCKQWESKPNTPRPCYRST